jgi:type IV fimbrial biogenesis protein FimT
MFTSRQSGFSLIESLVVITVLGVLFAMGLPAFQHYNSGLALKRSSERMLEEMRRARQRAASEHNNFIVTFNTASGTMQIHDDDNSDGAVNANEQVRTVTVADGVALAGVEIAPSDTLVFTLLGTLRDRNGGGFLTLTGCSGASDTLYVSAVGHISRS